MISETSELAIKCKVFISGIHLTGAATNPWIRFEFDSTLTKSKGRLN